MPNILKTDAVEAILQTRDPELSWTWSYVLTATRIPHDILLQDHFFTLLVPVHFKTRALGEIEGYLAESINGLGHDSGRAGGSERTIQPPTLLLIGTLILFYSITGPWNTDLYWFQNGAIDSTAILSQHQWYRLITALTLHADIVHLLSNCILGGFLLHFLLLLTGTGLGIFAVLIAGAAGNYINVLTPGPGHISVGFSTAVFSMIGILSMLSYSHQNRVIGLRILIPLMGSAALLAMLGSAGERTDLGSHVFGLLSGLLTGKILCLPYIQKIRHSIMLQILLFFAALSLLGVSWMYALRN